MADRSVKVTLRANVADFNQQIRSASTTLDKLVTEADKTGKVADTGLGRMAQRGQLMGSQLTTAGTAVTAFGAGLLGVATNAVRVAANFDQSMSNVQAATHETAGNMSVLREAALQAGQDTAFSATEAAGGIEELAKAGRSTSQIVGGDLKGALDLAAAGGMSVSDSAETMASAMTQFGAKAGSATHVADLLAAGAGKAQGSVSDMSQALNQSGLVASQMGLSIEETTGGLAAFASAGLIGSDAGTSFKTMLQRLSNPTAESAALMDQLGIHAYDAQGNFVGLANFAGQLSDKMGGLSTEQRNAALSTIFGSDAIRAATVLYSQGASGIQGWIDKVNDSGYAAETAAAKQNNLKGDLEKLGGSFETLWIRMGESAQGPLRSIVQAATSAVDAFGKLPAPVQSAVTAVAGLGGAALTGAGGFMLMLPRIMETRQAMQDLGVASGQLVAKFKELGGVSGTISAVKDSISGMSSGAKAAAVGAGVLTAGFIALKAATDSAQSSFEATASTADTIGARMSSGASGADVWKQALDGVSYSVGTFGEQAPAIDNLGAALKSALNPSTMEQFGQAMFGTATESGQVVEQIGKIGDALAGMDLTTAQEQFKSLWQAAGGGDQMGMDLLNHMSSFKASLSEMAAQAGMATDDATLLKLATGELSAESVGASSSMGDLASSTGNAATSAKDAYDAFNTLSTLFLGQRDASAALEKAYDDAAAAVQQYGQTANATKTDLDLTTEAGRANNEALEGIATAALKAADAMAQNGESAASISSTMSTARSNFIQTAMSMGLAEDAANKLADQMGLIPDKVSTQVTAAADEEGAKAAAQQTIAAAESQGDATLGITFDMGPLQKQLGQVGTWVTTNGPRPAMPVDANVVPAQTGVDMLKSGIAANPGTLTINGNGQPALATNSSVQGTVNATSGTQTIFGNGNPALGTNSAVQGKINGTSGTQTIFGNGNPALGTNSGVKSTIDNTDGTVGIYAADHATSAVNGIVAGFPSSHTITIRTNYVETHTTIQEGRDRLVNGHATGGAIYGPGTGTSDDIPAWLSNGEHVWTAREVQAIGGQARMYQLRAMARAGMLSKNALGFAEGGSPAVHAAVPNVYVNAGRNAAPTSNVTVVMDNPLTGEQIRKEARAVADGQIVRFARMGA